MESDQLFAFDDDIEDQIEAFCADHPRVTVPEVIRDVARIACIANLVRNGTLDDGKLVLCGGMAMRCLDSPRLSIWDGDTAGSKVPDLDALRDAIDYSDDDIALTASEPRSWKRGQDLVTAQPISYTPFFTRLDADRAEFSLSVASRGVELQAIRRPLNVRYPFPVLAQRVDVPIMHPHEILAEKLVAWWLFGHAKHYNDIAFLGAYLHADGKQNERQPVVDEVRSLVEKKLDGNRALGSKRELLVAELTPGVRRGRLEKPFNHLSGKQGHRFDHLSYLHAAAPTPDRIRLTVAARIVPMLFG